MVFEPIKLYKTAHSSYEKKKKKSLLVKNDFLIDVTLIVFKYDPPSKSSV